MIHEGGNSKNRCDQRDGEEKKVGGVKNGTGEAKVKTKDWCHRQKRFGCNINGNSI